MTSGAFRFSVILFLFFPTIDQHLGLPKLGQFQRRQLALRHLATESR